MFRRPWATVRAVLGNLLAVTLVALTIVGLNLLAGADPAGPDRGAGPVVVVPTPTPTPIPTVAPSTHGSPSASPSAPISPSASPSQAEFVRPPLTVLNSSRRSGLAARAAADFRSAGWPIAGTGNYRRSIPATTVYFEPGQEEAARRLMAEFPQVERMLPRPSGMPGSGLTVVVTRDYPA